MTRFVYIADTHVGAFPPAFSQQTPYPEKLPELAKALSRWIEHDGKVDFILHGGDMAHTYSEELIARAAQMFSCEVPLYLSLGNHDLTETGAKDGWLKHAPDFFPCGEADYSLDFPDCSVHVLVTHWENVPYVWRTEQSAHFLPEQKERLRKNILSRPGVTHILCTHAPACGLPKEQTGFDAFFHDPGESFRNEIDGIAAAFPDLRLILGAHNHLNMHVNYRHAHIVSTPSFCEAPFEFKLIELEGGAMRMKTIWLSREVGFETAYDFGKSFVQGRAIDRGFEENFA
jgi:DNA repair exonuclease SbcCD nuclease subunit